MPGKSSVFRSWYKFSVSVKIALAKSGLNLANVPSLVSNKQSISIMTLHNLSALFFMIVYHYSFLKRWHD